MSILTAGWSSPQCTSKTLPTISETTKPISDIAELLSRHVEHAHTAEFSTFIPHSSIPRHLEIWRINPPNLSGDQTSRIYPFPVKAQMKDHLECHKKTVFQKRWFLIWGIFYCRIIPINSTWLIGTHPSTFCDLYLIPCSWYSFDSYRHNFIKLT